MKVVLPIIDALYAFTWRASNTALTKRTIDELMIGHIHRLCNLDEFHAQIVTEHTQHSTTNIYWPNMLRLWPKRMF